MTMLIHALLIFPVTFLIVCYSIKKIIYISHMKHLFDEPSESRKIHKTKTPNLGGVAIFASMMFMSCLFLVFGNIPNLNFVAFAILALFILGLTDDLVGVDSKKKIAAQIVIAFVMVVLAEYRISSLHGLLGIFEIPYFLSVVLSMTTFVFLINAFNLIDGINCLAAGIGLLACSVLGFFFWEMNQSTWFYIAVALGACLSGFLLFNKTPARIFLGDAGSTFIGLILGWLSMNFMELNKPVPGMAVAPIFSNAPALIVSLLILPVFDTLRVFSIRLWNRRSPFAADRNHVHHRLIDLGFTHLQATGVLLMVNIISILFTWSLNFLDPGILLGIQIIYAILLNWLLSHVHLRKLSIPPAVVNIDASRNIVPTYKISVTRETV